MVSHASERSRALAEGDKCSASALLNISFWGLFLVGLFFPHKSRRSMLDEQSGKDPIVSNLGRMWKGEVVFRREGRDNQVGQINEDITTIPTAHEWLSEQSIQCARGDESSGPKSAENCRIGRCNIGMFVNGPLAERPICPCATLFSL